MALCQKGATTTPNEVENILHEVHKPVGGGRAKYKYFVLYKQTPTGVSGSSDQGSQLLNEAVNLTGPGVIPAPDEVLSILHIDHKRISADRVNYKHFLLRKRRL